MALASRWYIEILGNELAMNGAKFPMGIRASIMELESIRNVSGISECLRS